MNHCACCKRKFIGSNIVNLRSLGPKVATKTGSPPRAFKNEEANKDTTEDKEEEIEKEQ